jgi:hypothetical protein
LPEGGWYYADVLLTGRQQAFFAQGPVAPCYRDPQRRSAFIRAALHGAGGLASVYRRQPLTVKNRRRLPLTSEALDIISKTTPHCQESMPPTTYQRSARHNSDLIPLSGALQNSYLYAHALRPREGCRGGHEPSRSYGPGHPTSAETAPHPASPRFSNHEARISCHCRAAQHASSRPLSRR